MAAEEMDGISESLFISSRMRDYTIAPNCASFTKLSTNLVNTSRTEDKNPIELKKELIQIQSEAGNEKRKLKRQVHSIPPLKMLRYKRIAISARKLLGKSLDERKKSASVARFKSHICATSENLDSLIQSYKIEKDGQLTIDIIDHGSGISKEEKEKLFQPFTQANKTVHSQFGGSGMGLWISSKLIQAMGGNIKCDSILGKGSCFSVIVPANVEQRVKVYYYYFTKE